MTLRSLVAPFAALLVAALAALPAAAGPIGLGAFGPRAVLQSFAGLGLGSPVSTPLLLDGVTYRSDSGLLSYGRIGLRFTVEEGVAARNDEGWIDVVFDSPVRRAGALVGASPGRADFYDASDRLLGSVTVAIGDPPRSFAGFESDGLPIRRIRFTDVGGVGKVLALDELLSEVPEPGTLLLGLSGILGLSIVGRARRFQGPIGSGDSLADPNFNVDGGGFPARPVGSFSALGERGENWRSPSGKLPRDLDRLTREVLHRHRRMS